MNNNNANASFLPWIAICPPKSNHLRLLGLLLGLVPAGANRRGVDNLGRDLHAGHHVAVRVCQGVAHLHGDGRIKGFDLEVCLVLVELAGFDWAAGANGGLAGIRALLGELELSAAHHSLDDLAQRAGLMFGHEVRLHSDISAQIDVANGSVARTGRYADLLDVLGAAVGEIYLHRLVLVLAAAAGGRMAGRTGAPTQDEQRGDAEIQ